MTLSPTTGPAGTQVTATGSDWPAGDQIQAIWGSTSGPNTGPQVNVAADGTFTDTFAVPAGAALGSTQVFFWDIPGRYFEMASTPFDVTPPPAGSSCASAPAVTFSPDSGPVGTVFTVAGTGWQPGGTVTSTLPYGSPGWFTGYQTPTVDASGGFSYQLTAGTGPNGPTPAGAYAITYVEKYDGCSLSVPQTFTVTPAPAPPATPAPPSNLTATPADPHDIKLTWQDNSGNETGFEVSNGVTSTTVGPNSTTYTWGGLAPNTYMCFKIRSYNSAGSSPWDPNVSPWYVCTTTPKPPTVTVPAAPSGLTATAVDPHDIKLAWQDNSGNETGFEISNGVTSTTVGANSTTYTWGGLAPNTYMCFKIRSTNSAGTSAWDPNVSPWYVCATTPPEPTIYWSQTDGPPGTHFTLTGNGWLPGGTVQVGLSSGSTGDFYFSSASAPVDSHGSWHESVAVGDAPAGTYQLTFREAAGNLQVTGTFHVSAAPADATGNWDGYAERYGAQYTSVSASWTEPKYPLAGGNGLVGLWVGLGGIGSPLQQIGTSVGYGMKFQNGRPTGPYYAWWETVTDPNGHPSLIKKPVKPGDKFNASVTYNGQAYVLELSDLTEGWSFTRINQQAQDNTSSAEVILESPNGTHLPYFLSPVTFTNIEVNGTPMQNPTPEIITPPLNNGSWANVGPFQNNSFTAYPWRK